MLITIPTFLFAGTLFESEKRTSDPYIADRGGFNSLFVNPAGAAGQSGFELSVNFGARTTSNDVKLIMGVADMAMSMDDADGLSVDSIEDVGQTLSELADSGVINDALLESIFGGTSMDPYGPDGVPGGGDDLDWTDPAAVQAAAEALDTSVGGDLDTIQIAVEGIMDGSNTDFYDNLPGEITMEALASFKTGFLIKGWGLGIYDHAVGVAYMDPVDQTYGLKTIYNELGAIAGGGFNVLDGKLALGLSGNYGILMRNTDPVGFEDFDTLINGSVNYGYSWGVDVGAIWRPTPALGVGVVLNDIVGSTQADTPYTAAGISGFFEDGSYLMDEFDYEVTIDVDAGISWQPDWRFVRPKLGIDLYNVVGYGRDVADNGDDFEAAMYRSLEHLRLGANFTFFDFLKIGAQYTNHYVSAGLGLDLLFLELYGEFKIHDQGFYEDDWGDVPIGGDLMVRIHF